MRGCKYGGKWASSQENLTLLQLAKRESPEMHQYKSESVGEGGLG